MKRVKNICGALCLLLTLASVQSFAQEVEFKSANFKDDKEGFKKATEAIKAGDELLEKANAALVQRLPSEALYKMALQQYMVAQNFNNKSAEVNAKIGNCLIFCSRKSEAKPYIENAWEWNKEAIDILPLLKGRSQQLDMDFKGALATYKQFSEEASNKLGEAWAVMLKKYMKECQTAPEIVENPLRIWVDNLTSLNSDQDDYSPCISTDGETMIFTSRRENGKPMNDRGEYDADIYTSILDGRVWGAPIKGDDLINTDQDDVTGSIAYDGQRMMMFKEENGNTDIYESTLDGLQWSQPVRKLGKVPNTENNEMFASYEPNDIKVYYIFDGGHGGDYDIFITGLMVKKDNIWGKGSSAGHQINTKFHESSVFVHPDGETMYFSSEGHNSLGGSDIFMSKFELGQWTAPVNLGYPINTPYDDVFFAGTANGKHAYIASNRPGGKGGFDLYKVTFWGPDKSPMVDSEDYLLSSVAQPVKEAAMEKAVKVNKLSLTVFKGKIIDHLTNEPLGAPLVITDVNSGEAIQTVNSNKATGKFLVSLPAGRNYAITVDKEGYLFHSENFDVPAGGAYNMVSKTIELKNIAVGSKIALRNVFFETGKADIKPESHNELARLIQLLKDVPALKIELGGHTDNVGSESLNSKLSQERAEAVVAYLKSKGIAADRLSAKGYGSSQPVAPNTSSEGRAQNRRTEFMITAN